MSEKRKSGRRPMSEKDPLFEKKVAKAYEHYRSLRKVADIMGCSFWTISSYLKKAGVEINKKGHYNSNAGKRTVYWKLSHFEKTYGVPLPRNFKDISRLLKMKSPSVYRVFLRMRKQIEKVIDEIVDLKTIDYPGVYCEGMANDKIKIGIYLNKDIEEYFYQADKYLQFVMLCIKRKNDSSVYKVYIKNIYIFRDEVNKYVFGKQKV